MPRPGLRRTLAAHGTAACRAYLRHVDDRRLERTLGSGPALRVLFRSAESAFVPAAAEGFTGELACALRTADGAVRPWTLSITPEGAHARPGPAIDPRLTIEMGVADLIRIAAGELDADAALLAGRLDLVGDFSLALRLGAMFGR